MSKKLYVGSLPYSVNNQTLEKIFAPMGAVVSAQVITDMETGRSKGFGFVEMSTEEEAKRAIKELNGTTQDGRVIVVSEARPQASKGGGGRSGGGRSGGGRGGYGGNSGNRGGWGS